MRTFIIRRFFFLILAVLAATLIVFTLSRLQGDPRAVMLNVGYVSPEQWEAWGKRFHLDKPLILQYLIWVGKGFFQGDFGESLKTGKPVMDMVRGFRSSQPPVRALGHAICPTYRYSSWDAVCGQARDHLGRNWQDVRGVWTGPAAILVGDHVDPDFQCQPGLASVRDTRA